VRKIWYLVHLFLVLHNMYRYNLSPANYALFGYNIQFLYLLEACFNLTQYIYSTGGYHYCLGNIYLLVLVINPIKGGPYNIRRVPVVDLQLTQKATDCVCICELSLRNTYLKN